MAIGQWLVCGIRYCVDCNYIYNVLSDTLIYKIGENQIVHDNCPKCDLKLVRVYRHINPQKGKQKWSGLGKYCKRCKYIWIEKKEENKCVI